MRELKFIGSSKKDLLAMPEDAIDVFGYALDRAQRGLLHDDAKPFKGYAAEGVFEIVYDDGDAYRALYATKIGAKIYVLHCFQKKSPRGRATPKPELTTLKARLKTASQDAKDDENEREAGRERL